MKFWDFLLAADSGENFPKILVLMLVFLAASFVLSFLEHKFRQKWLWVAANAILSAFAVLVFLIMGAGLSEVLLYLLAFLLVRICFVMWEGRSKS